MLAVVALIAALAGPVVLYVTTARKASGTIKSSEAADLWKAQEDTRLDYRHQIAVLREQLAETEKRCADRIEALERTIADLRAGGAG